MKALFFGTPDVAVPYLELLAREHELLAVVSQPDRPAGRGLAMAPTPVKAKAAALGVARVFQPEKPALVAAELASLRADVAVVVAYGRILKPEVLRATRLGFLNVHFSLLPGYRGAAPVQWALAAGETRTGVTAFWLDEGMDTGPIARARETEIGADEDAGQLLGRLRDLGVEVLREALADVAAGREVRRPQAGQPSLAPLIKPQDARLDLRWPARRVHDHVRGFRLWPRAFLELAVPRGRQRLLVLKTRVEPTDGPAPGRPGRIVRVERDGSILIECLDGSRLWFLAVQPDGKKLVTAAEFLNGLRIGAGDVLPLADHGI